MRTGFFAGVISLISLAGLSAVYADGSLAERGDYLVNGVASCGNCHTPRTPDAEINNDMELAGTYLIDDPGFKAYAPNITMDEETGIGSWSDEEIARAIREGIRPDGSVIGPPMPNYLYRNMSDSDLNAIIAYLRTVKPVKNAVPESEYRFPLPENWGPPVDSVPDVPRTDRLAYATYLAETLGHCNDCHSPIIEGQHDFARTGLGGYVFENLFDLGITAVSANITPHKEYGIGSWTDEEIKRALTDGVRPDGRKLAKVMGFPYYKRMREEDLDLLVLYMRSLKPQPQDK